jgi:hypothetical protein
MGWRLDTSLLSTHNTLTPLLGCLPAWPAPRAGPVRGPGLPKPHRRHPERGLRHPNLSSELGWAGLGQPGPAWQQAAGSCMASLAHRCSPPEPEAHFLSFIVHCTDSVCCPPLAVAQVRHFLADVARAGTYTGFPSLVSVCESVCAERWGALVCGKGSLPAEEANSQQQAAEAAPQQEEAPTAQPAHSSCPTPAPHTPAACPLPWPSLARCCRTLCGRRWTARR